MPNTETYHRQVLAERNKWYMTEMNLAEHKQEIK